METTQKLREAFVRYIKNKYTAEDFRLIQHHFHQQTERDILYDLIAAELGNESPADDQRIDLILNKTDVHIARELRNRKTMQPIPLYRKRYFRIAAAAIVVCCLGYVLWMQEAPAKMLTVTVSYGELKQLTLPDSTNVWLNAGSTFTYPEKFRSGKREVSLTGEAYFEVKHLTNKPFLIHTDQLTTQVVGTSFNIKAYQEDKTSEVIVVTGKVSVMANGLSAAQKTTELLVTPNQRAVYNKQEQSLTSQNQANPSLAIAWKKGKLLFTNVPLAEVVMQLKRSYNVSISYTSKLALCPVFADFTGEPLDKIVQILALSLNGTAIEQNGGYYINGKACH